MAETVRYLNQERTKEGALIIPLDDVRTLDNVTSTVVSGTSSVLYTIVSGKEGYLRKAVFSELSGVPALIQLHTPTGSGLSVTFPVTANTVVDWDICPCGVGPILSGITIQSPRFSGELTLIVTIDPKKIE